MNAVRLAIGSVALAGLLAAPVHAQKKPTLDKGLEKKLATLAEHWWKARPPTRFVEWDPKRRAELETEARALGRLPEGALDLVVELLWAPGKKLAPKSAVEKGKLVLATPYGEAWSWFVPGGKKPALVLGLHGGGAGAGSADEARSNWTRKNALGIFPQGIRLVDDTWNTVHGERFVLTLIDIAKVRYDVDPDRVYVMGFSMGGSGSWFFAGRHPDLFAGAAPFSGVLMAAPKSQLETKEEVVAIQHGLVPNVRNLAMHYTIGLADRNCMPGTYLFAADVLAKLRADDPSGYAKIRFEAVPGLAHEFPSGEPERAFAYLLAQERETFPATLVWEHTRAPSPEAEPEDLVARIAKRRFYWLGCDEPEERQRIRATRAGNEITLDLRATKAGAKGITIFLNGRMIDPAAVVVVRTKDAELWRGKPEPDVWTVLDTLDERLDRSMVFDRRIEL